MGPERSGTMSRTPARRTSFRRIVLRSSSDCICDLRTHSPAADRELEHPVSLPAAAGCGFLKSCSLFFYETFSIAPILLLLLRPAGPGIFHLRARRGLAVAS